MKRTLIPFLLLALAGFSLSSCDKTPPTPTLSDSLTSDILTGYADLVLATYEDALTTAGDLKSALVDFTNSPSDATLQAAKDAWLASREPYGQTEVYRFYAGPIDNEIDGPEGELNAWPLDESFIDYVESNANSGIVNDPSVSIDAATLRSKNEQDGVEENVATGYHAIEFFLWGQDDLDASLKTPGDRPFTDYTSLTNADRRKQYLLVCADLLIEDLQALVDAWTPGAAYRTQFVDGGKESLGNILTGMGSLSKAELSGERMKVALVNHDQEDEHSCFSDNTHRDIVTNAAGIQNVFLGKYDRVDGSKLEVTALDDIGDEVLRDEISDLQMAIDASMSAVNVIQAPFDWEISASNPDGNARVQAAIDALESQTDFIQVIADELGISINTEG